MTASLPIGTASAAGPRRPAGPGTDAPSIRALAGRYLATLGILTALVAAALVWTATQLERTTNAITRESSSLALARDIERDAAEYRQLADLAYVTREPELAGARSELLRELRGELAPGARAAGAHRERELIESASRGLEVYLAAREDLEQRGVPLAALAEGTRPSLDRVRSDLAELRDRSEASLAETEAGARRTAAIAEAVATGASVLLALGVLWVFSVIRRSVSLPLVEISSAIRRFRMGEPSARPPHDGARELCELSDAFDAMAAALARQREAQLAFLAGVAHDLRNPLQPLKLAARALSSAQSGDSRGRVVAMIDRQVDRLSRLVDDVLDSARIEAGHLELHRERIDLRTSAREAVDLLGPSTLRHEIALESPEEPIWIDADPLRVGQVLVNLLGNAIKYSPAGGRIDVRVARTETDALIEVRDRGIGMPPEGIDDIFEPFRRRAPEVAGGAGLGLSVARHIVVAHGGSIEVESSPGQGSTFRVRIPLSLERRPEADTHAPP